MIFIFYHSSTLRKALAPALYINCIFANILAAAVRKVDNATHRISHYPLDSAIGFAITYPLDWIYSANSVIHRLNNWGVAFSHEGTLAVVYHDVHLIRYTCTCMLTEVCARIASSFTNVLLTVFNLRLSWSFITYNRCTLLEPGPVKTSVAENSIAWGKSIDISTADQKTQDMLKLCSEHLGRWVATALEANDVALIVKEIILGQNTNFRCQTNVDFLAPEIAAKLKDPASNEPIDMLENRLYGKK